MGDATRTRASLPIRVRDNEDPEAWGQFVALYGPQIYQFARKQGLQDANAADLTQIVLQAVIDAMKRLDYDLEDVIDHGSMGVAFRAFDEKLRRIVAVKVMSPLWAADGAGRQRFLREARAAAAIRDEHVVAVHAVEECRGLPYLVTDYIPGGSLQHRIDDGRLLPIEEVVRIGWDVALGLAAAHVLGLVHRDIKPANILLDDRTRRAKIVNFGLARTPDDAGLTHDGIVVGTPQFMAPEQARGDPVDHRADLFSLGERPLHPLHRRPGRPSSPVVRAVDHLLMSGGPAGRRHPLTRPAARRAMAGHRRDEEVRSGRVAVVASPSGRDRGAPIRPWINSP